MDKQSTFKNLGEIIKSSEHFDIVRVSDIDVIYLRREDNLFLERRVKINQKNMAISLTENGSRHIRDGNDKISVKRCVENHYIIISKEQFVNYCMEKGIIISREYLRQNLINGYAEYKVKFHHLIKLDFKDTPDSISKYFMALYSEETVVDMDVEFDY